MLILKKPTRVVATSDYVTLFRSLVWRLVCAVCGLLLCGAGYLWGEEEQSVVKNWTVLDGLPSNQVTALAQSDDGYLWVGTSAGLVRFDGYRLVKYQLGEKETYLPIAEVAAIRGGGIWVKDGNNDCYWLRDKEFSPYDSPWLYLIEGADGYMYGYNKIEVARLDAEGNVAKAPVAFPEARSPQREGRLYVSTKGQIWALLRKPEEKAAELWMHDGKEWRQISEKGLFWNNARFLGKERNDALWLGEYSSQAYRFEGAEYEVFIYPDEFQFGVHFIEEDGWGRVWAAPWAGGMWMWAGKEPKRLAMVPGERQPEVTALYCGKGGELWVGTSDQGLFRVVRARVSSYQVDNKSTGKVTALLPEADGSVLVGTEGSGCFRWQKSGVARFTENAYFNRVCIYGNDFLRLANGSVWVGAGLRLHEFQGAQLLTEESFSQRFVEVGDSITSLCADRKEGFWACTRLGKVCYIRDRTIEEIALPREFRGLVSINCDSRGHIWVAGGRGGLIEVTPSREVSIYDREEGIPDVIVTAMFIDAQDKIWLGTHGEGLWCWDGKTCSRVVTNGVRPIGTVLQIQQDEEGWLWLGTLSGICGLNPALLPEPVPLLWLGTRDGMASEQCMRMRAVRDAQGRLYFGTTRGFTVFDPKEVKQSTGQPRPVIEELWIDSDVGAYPWEEGEELPPGSRFEVVFTGLGPELADDLQFRARLVGLEDNWHLVPMGRTRRYGPLPPGDYRFELQVGRYGQWSPMVAILPLRIAPFLWQAWWFKTLVLLVFLAAGAGILKLIEWRRWLEMKAELERHRAVNEERRRIARNLHDSMGAELTHATLLAHLWDESQPLPDTARKLRERLRALSSELDNAVWATDPAFDTLPAVCDYLINHASNFLHDARISCEINVVERIPPLLVSPQARQHLLHAVKEALANVSRHAKATQAWFGLAVQDHWLIVAVHDNGAGFDPALAAQKRRHGLRHIQERLQMVGGKANITSSPEGTNVELRIPLQKAV